jgi:hypothetical protein
VTPLGASLGIDARAVRGAGAAVVLTVLLGAAGGVSLPVAVGVPIAGAGVALLWRSRPGPVAAEYGLLPFLVALGTLAVLAAPSILTGALAGFAGLSFLIWNAETPREVVRGSDPFAGIAVPGLCLAAALLAAIVLPGGRAAVGVAGVTIVVAFGLVVWALGETWRTRPVPAKGL